MNPFVRVACVALALAWFAPVAHAQRQMENLGRGVVALRQDDKKVFVSWRVLGTDPGTLAFNLYRATDGAAPMKLNAAPITGASNSVDLQSDATHAQARFPRRSASIP